MAGARQKAPELLVNAKGGRGRGVVVSAGQVVRKTPPLPKLVTAPLRDPVQARLQPEAVRHARRVWSEWWRSTPARAVNIESDFEALAWWIVCVFRRALYVQLVIQQPMVNGSAGQPVPNPLESVIRGMTADISRTEAKFGMTTQDRFRLAIQEADGPGPEDEAEHRALAEYMALMQEPVE